MIRLPVTCARETIVRSRHNLGRCRQVSTNRGGYCRAFRRPKATVASISSGGRTAPSASRNFAEPRVHGGLDRYRLLLRSCVRDRRCEVHRRQTRGVVARLLSSGQSRGPGVRAHLGGPCHSSARRLRLTAVVEAIRALRERQSTTVDVSNPTVKPKMRADSRATGQRTSGQAIGERSSDLVFSLKRTTGFEPATLTLAR
jgi:hypothetical protein